MDHSYRLEYSYNKRAIKDVTKGKLDRLLDILTLFFNFDWLQESPRNLIPIIALEAAYGRKKKYLEL